MSRTNLTWWERTLLLAGKCLPPTLTTTSMAVDADDGADENVDIQNGSLSKFMADASPPPGSSIGQFYGRFCNLLKNLSWELSPMIFTDKIYTSYTKQLPGTIILYLPTPRCKKGTNSFSQLNFTVTRGFYLKELLILTHFYQKSVK